MKYRILWIWLFVTLGISVSGPAKAINAATDWVTTDQTSVRLIAASEAVGDSHDVKLGLQFKMQPGWKIYWRSPGDAGFPPQLDWDGSSNLIDASLNWPAPERFSVLGLETLGYKDEVVLPISARMISPSQNADLKLSIKYLTCNEICIPYDSEFSLSLPPGNLSPSSFAHLIDRYRASVPGDGQRHGLNIVSASAQENGVWTGLRLNLTSQTPFENPDVFVEGAIGLAYSKPEVSLSADKRQAVVDIAVDGLEHVDDDIGQTLDGRRFIITLADGMRSAEKSLPVSLVKGDNKAIKSNDASISLLTILGFALLGGLILNLMPCVLPVLSIKLLSAIKHGGGDRHHVRLSFIASATGIVFAFLIIAAALVALKVSGGAIGWGIQFQQPWFLILMTIIVILFACNLWGFFEISLPRVLADIGGGSAHTDGLGGHFVQGAFATLLATPCSAPFLGTAVGFALARGPLEIFSVFSALGIGLASPYLAVALFPSLATRLPKPGLWMIRLRQILGFALLATALWLLSVLYAVTTVTSVIILGVMICAIIITLFVAFRFPAHKQKTSAVVAIIILATILYPIAPADKNQAMITSDDDAIRWQKFDEATIGRLVATGRTVLVDVTADWCITCQVNKAVVLGQDPVLSLLADGSVDAVKADWTLPDDTIARYLARYGRYGIPFNIVYGPGAPEGIPLPELLTEDLVMDAISAATAKKTAAASTEVTN
jgi:suppressor for copper-sensitivity B